MTDPVLQSFCERCGSRYTFSEPEATSAEQPKARLGLFGRRPPRPSEEPESAPTSSVSASAEHFAGIFHFCLDCRQYVCTKCWNQEAGGCLTCRPQPPDGLSGLQPGAEGSPFLATPARETWPEDDVARASMADIAKPADSRPARQAAPGAVELDEWGRPRPPQPTSRPAAESAKAPLFGAQDAVMDPWRGVVFSADEAGADLDEAGPPPARGLSDRLSAAGTGQPSPERDQPFGTSQAPRDPADTWPAADDRPEPDAAPEFPPVTEDGPVVEASNWAITSAAIVGRVSMYGPQRQTEPELELESAPEPELEPQPELALDSEPEPMLPEPEPDAIPTVEPQAVAEPEPTPDAAPAPDLEAGQAAEPPIEAETEPVFEPEAFVAVEPELVRSERQPTLTVESAALAAPEPEPAAVQEPEAETEPEVEAEPEPAPDAIPVAEPEPEPEAAAPEPSPGPMPQPGATPALEPEPAAAAGPELTPALEPESIPMPMPRPASTPSVPELPPPLPSSPIAPIVPPQPPAGIEVWNVRNAPGPFNQPYQAPVSPTLPVAPPPTAAPRVFTPPPTAAAPPGPLPPTAPPLPPLPPLQGLPPAPPPPMPPMATTFSPVPPPGMAGTAPPPATGARPGSGSFACANCGLPLSSKARFCRRCGAPQG